MNNLFLSLFVALCCVCNVYGNELKQALCSNFDEKAYERAETIFINNTNQLEQQVLFIEERLMSRLSAKENFLDIGPGPGYITQRIAKNFKSTAVVEPISAYQRPLSEMGFKVVSSLFQNAEVQSSDLVLCSHVLYHVDRASWKDFLEKIYSKVNKGGKGLVVLLSPNGRWAEVHNTLNSDYSNSSYIKKALDELNINYEVFPVSSFFRSSCYEDFAELVRLFTIDNSFSSELFKSMSESEKKSILNIVEEYIAECKQPDGSYEAIWTDDYFILNK